ncbi:MAG: FecR family protein [Agriterribacter sp.]
MQITRKLIQQFLEGRCKPETEALIRNWLNENPEQLSRLMTEESWEAFVSDTTSVEASPKMYEYIVRRTQPSTNKWKWKWVAAASTTALLSCSIFYFAGRQQPLAVEPVVSTQPLPHIVISSTAAATHEHRLPDGSIAILSPGSTIQYDRGFASARNIVLTGEASFSVAKDSSKPFCVHAKNINVTALGTMFSVSDADSLMTSVKLFEGKVVVRKEAHASKKLEAIFLHPGEELSFNNKDFSYTLVSIEKKEPVRKRRVLAKIPNQPTAVLYFDNQPLEEIFNELAKLYGIKISFVAGAVQDLRFTGAHNPASETLEKLLNTIAMLNDLKVKKTRSGAFEISPNQ